MDKSLMGLADIINILLFLFIIRGELVTELLSRVLPVRPDGEVVHGEGRVPRQVLLNLQEWREGVNQLIIIGGGEGLKQDEVLAPGVARCSVDVQLVLLVLVQE